MRWPRRAYEAVAVALDRPLPQRVEEARSFGRPVRLTPSVSNPTGYFGVIADGPSFWAVMRDSLDVEAVGRFDVRWSDPGAPTLIP